MRLKIALDANKISEIKNFSGEYIELLYSKKMLILSSVSGITCIFGSFRALEGDNEDFCIRVESSIFDKLSTETYLDLTVLPNEIRLLYYDEHDKFLYSIVLDKQQGFMEIKDKLELVKNLNEYESIDITPISSLISLFSKINVPISCNNGIAYGYFNHSYFFKKFKTPSFSCDSKLLRRVFGMNKSIRLIGQYIYSNLTECGNHLFINKFRLSEAFDLDYVLKTKVESSFTVDFSNLFKLSRRISIPKDTQCFLDFNKNRLVLKISNSKSVECNCVCNPLVAVEDNKPTDLDISKMLENIKLGNKSSINLNDSTLGKFPILQLPSWVVRFCITKKLTKFYLSRNFIIMTVSGGKIIFSRGEPNE